MKKYCQNIIPALFIIILLLIWEAAVGFFHIPLYVLPSPVQVIRTLFSELGTWVGHSAVKMCIRDSPLKENGQRTQINSSRN